MVREKRLHGNGIREKVVGEHNHVEFEGPAVVKLCMSGHSNRMSGEMEEEKTVTAPPLVLLIVKRGDDELLRLRQMLFRISTALSNRCSPLSQ